MKTFWQPLILSITAVVGVNRLGASEGLLVVSLCHHYRLGDLVVIGYLFSLGKWKIAYRFYLPALGSSQSIQTETTYSSRLF